MSFDDFHGPNIGYILELYERFQNDPESVDESARKFFQHWSPTIPAGTALQPAQNLIQLSKAADLAEAIRSRGYLAATLDPLGSTPIGDPSLTAEFYNLNADDLQRVPAEVAGFTGENAFQAIENLRSIYCKAIGYDYGHIRVSEERQWLYQSAESGRFRTSFDEAALLQRLTQVEAFELFLHRLYPGKTRFSIEGLDMLVPMLDEIVGASARANICAILIGMAHRGRLNVLAHILHKPYTQIFAEFKDPKGRATTWDELGWTGDVKYHMGAHKSPKQDQEADLVIRLPANPSHLELIDPYIIGMARAADEKVDHAGAPIFFKNASLPLLIHGDGSFAGQGIVAETLNMSRLAGYTTSGSLHIIANNQVGFTATDNELRSSLHASDVAKGFEMPVIHVNADDPLACIEAARTAIAYRQEFHKDFVINLIGYRRYGHNEGDEPRFTNPVMYQAIDNHPTVRQLWASGLEAKGVVDESQVEALLQSRLKELQEVNEQLDAEKALREPLPKAPPQGAAGRVKTAVPLKQLKELNAALLEFPEEFHLNPKLKKSVERRRTLFDKPTKDVDWATAEDLAFASILQDGIPIRLTGEDSARGTFSQRHAAFYDAENGAAHIPLQTFPQSKASFEILNSPLTEGGTIGFEVGYNMQAPDRLVLWEAQYGDFINNAQTMLDEFLLSGRAKWGLTPSLVLLLPHGNEGQGPDHSSARIERFLGLAAEKNVRIAYPSIASQYFHLLRRQALLLETDPLPLIVFTPKGLLRHPLVASPVNLLSEGGWQAVIDDAELPSKKKDVENLILCSGRVYFDLVTSDLRKSNLDDAIVRVEQLYPFPKQALEDVMGAYPNLKRLIWAQEEPLNMGAWNYLRPRLRQLTDDRLPLHYVGRPESSSPAEGSSTLYRINQQELIEQAFEFEKQTRTRSVVKERG
ncbi:MAG TPA: 2-oxoglutarate dehydrogenase E1 component [Anaerolineae bacterium]|nr:2-oxoglutarate dehydrogenase E1 component [Anaerolineae bacterium]